MSSVVNPVTYGSIKSRVKLYEYSTGNQTFFQWQAGMLPQKESVKVLELGCGDGALWRWLLPRWPSCDLTLTDISTELVTAAENEVASISQQLPATVTTEVVDLNSLNYPDGSFDVVIANHNLFYATDVGQVLGDIHRILSPGGQLICSTIGADHLYEVVRILRAQTPDLAWEPETFARRFGLENGAQQLLRWFDHVDQFEYDNNLHVSSLEPLFVYILKTLSGQLEHLVGLNEEDIKALFLSAFNERGYIRLTPHSGFFMAEKSKS